MSELPSWVNDQIKKGASLSDCLEMLKLLSEKDREERKIEREERQAEREMKKAALDHEFKVKELALKEEELKVARANGGKSNGSSSVQNSHVKLPKLEEGQDIDVFLRSFEKLAALHKWDKSEWAIHLVPLLTGKALEAYSRLSDGESGKYDKIKEAILKRYELTSEAYREKFRQARQQSDESFKDYQVRTEKYLSHWCEREDIHGQYNSLYDLVLREQLLKFCDKDLQVWVHEHRPKNVKEVIDLVEAYQTAHKRLTFGGNRKNGTDRNSQGNFNVNQGQFKAEQGKGPQVKDRACYYCKRPGHIQRDCSLYNRGQYRKPEDKKIGKLGLCLSEHENKQHTEGGKPDLYTSAALVKLPGVSTGDTKDVDDNSVPGLDISRGSVGGKEATVLRDTGCSTVFVHSRLVEKEQMTGRGRKIILADGSEKQCQEACVEIDTPFIKGKLFALILDSPFADVILGNVIDKIEKMEVEKPADCLAVQTRAQTRLEAEETKPRPKKTDDGELKFDICDTETLIKLQETDPSLTRVREMTFEKPDEGQSYYTLKDKILYRVFPREVGNDIFQIVLPHKYRSLALEMAHDIPMSGHMGVKKTRNRILQHFFWPGIFSDTSKYCRSCPECQKGTAKGRVKKVPLVSIPTIDEPFQRIALDFVGPLPLTESKNRFVLVCVDYATKYPIAVALKNQEAETVAEALMGIFADVGFPNEILTDQGSNFMSELIKELCRLLKVSKLVSSPYHPQTNGLVEKFNGTLKKMLKAYAVKEPSKWDKHLPYVLFAYREVPNETTGFSPFEMLFARQVRGPLAVLKDHWEEPENCQSSVLSYLLETRERLKECTELAKEKEKVEKHKQKVYYDRKARTRQYEVGDKVLVLLPSNTSKLLAQWKGPFEITEKVGNVDYRVKVKRNKETVFHVNMLKKWYDREDKCEQDLSKEHLSAIDILGGVYESMDYDSEFNDRASPSLELQKGAEDVIFSDTLSNTQVCQLRGLLNEFSDVFSDIPNRTDVVQHSVKLKSDDPVHKKPYPVPYALRERMQKEIDNMTEVGIIEPSTSPYASPVVLVRKDDSSIRFCCDYRALNSITVFDPRPMPRMDDLLNEVSRAKFISKIDLTKGYWQIPLDEDAKQKSAFVTPMGHYQFTVMPFGMVNAPATFVRLMHKVLDGLHSFVQCFIDDIGIYSETWDDHLQHLRVVFQRLRDAKLSAKPSKCCFGFDQLEFLGHVVGKGIVSPKQSKVQAIQKFPVPTTKKHVRSFLGTIGFYRKFIPHFSELASPLFDLTRKKGCSKIVWLPVHQKAFDSLKNAIASNPVLRSPDFSKLFYLRTDASDCGVGAVLEQNFEDGRHPILYLSKKLSDTEKRYAVIEKECFAIIWSIKSLRVFLEGRSFVVESDHAPLQWLDRIKMTNQRLLRWSLTLQEFNFEVVHVKGKDNVVADYLSRIDSSS